MRRTLSFLAVAFISLNTFSQTREAFVNNIVQEVNANSKLESLAHELVDLIGPRLVGTPQIKQANDWVIKKYAALGIPAANQQYGTWRSWQRGITHIDMIAPRVKTLEGMQLAWSPSTNGKTLTGQTIVIPESVTDSASLVKWLPKARGKFVLISPEPATGIPFATWDEFGFKDNYKSISAIDSTRNAHAQQRLLQTGRSAFFRMLDRSGALGLLSMYWSRGYGVNKIFSAYTKNIPVVDIALEDYGLLYRLTQSGNTPTISLKADSKELGTAPVYNTIATLKGSTKPEEYIVLSAHLDSWDGATGATDNGTGTILMMEVMRLLKKYYPNPKRTIIAGHWNSEEQGLNGSRAFVADHPEIVKNIQAVFNQDNGTGRISFISGQGFKNASAYFNRWLEPVPDSIRSHIQTTFPGIPGGGGSDHAAFVAASAPAFMLGSNSWNYGTYTWHTNRDTYDKIVFDEVKKNVILVAILAYMASEDPERTPHAFETLPVNERTGKPHVVPEVRAPERNGGFD